MAAPKFRIPITEETEIYRDLGIYGDEIVDLVWWLEKEFEVKNNIDPFRYAPHEGNFLWIVWIMPTIRKIMGIEPKYESLKVSDLLTAIKAGHWHSKA
jgi:hypothetical protein